MLFFFQVFYIHIDFRINNLLTYLNCIVSWIFKTSRIHVHVSYRTCTRTTYLGFIGLFIWGYVFCFCVCFSIFSIFVFFILLSPTCLLQIITNTYIFFFCCSWTKHVFAVFYDFLRVFKLFVFLCRAWCCENDNVCVVLKLFDSLFYYKSCLIHGLGQEINVLLSKKMLECKYS